MVKENFGMGTNSFEKSNLEKAKLATAKAGYKKEEIKKKKIIKEMQGLGKLIGVPLRELDNDTGKEDLMNYKVSKNRDYLSSYNLETMFSNEDSLESFLEDFKLNDFEKEEMEELPFEDRDILGEEIKKIKAKKLAQEIKDREEENILEYSTFEFKSMQNAFRFETFLDKFPMVEQKRPKYADGKSLTDSEIESSIKEYYEIKDNIKKGKDRWSNYSTREIKLMNKCAEWGFFAKEYRKQKKMERPAFADGQEMTIEEINKLANEYKELKQKDPSTFAELKAEVGEWGKGNFKWKKEIFKSKVQYISILKENGITKKFIIRKEDLPNDFKLEERNTINFYSIVDFFEIPEKKFSIFYIKLRKPYNTEERKRKKLIYSSKPKFSVN